MRPVNEIIIHCTATRPGWWKDKTAAEKTAELKRWHVEDRKWRNIGYHYTIDRDGTITEGRSMEENGAHTKGRNKNTCGIALFGGFGSTSNDRFSENFTPEQMASLQQLIADLMNTYPINKISGHNQYAPKACPGFNVSNYFK